MPVISTDKLKSYRSKMNHGKSISRRAVRKYAKGGRVPTQSKEDLEKDIAQMERALHSSHINEAAKEKLKAAIGKAEGMLDKLKGVKYDRKTKTVARPSLLKKAINANTPKGQPDADKMMSNLRKRNAMRKTKAEKKKLEVNKAKFASMEEEGTIWPKSPKTGERVKPKRKRPAVKKKKK